MGRQRELPDAEVDSWLERELHTQLFRLALPKNEIGRALQTSTPGALATYRFTDVTVHQAHLNHLGLPVCIDRCVAGLCLENGAGQTP